METEGYLKNYYERYDEEGRLTSKHGMVEYITTMKYIEKYLKPDMRVLEIGAATGRYSHALAQKGYRVDAVELVEHNIEIFKTLSEAIRVTKKGGIVFAAYCMGDACVLSYGFMRGEIYNIIKKCMLDTETFDTFSNPWDIFELHRKEDIDKLCSEFNITRLHFIAADGYTNHMRETVDKMDDRMYELYLKYHLAVCERQDMLGYSHHTLDIFRKE